jgi:hypothetical protein
MILQWGKLKKEVATKDDLTDDLGQAIHDAQRECESEKEKIKFELMLEDHKKLLYPTCDVGQKKLDTTLELLAIEGKEWCIRQGIWRVPKNPKKLPKDKELLATTYEAKQVVCPLGLEIQKIHACPNDCVLYRGEEYEKLDACPVCHVSWYKIRQDDPSNVEGERPRKKIPTKVMWYAPIIPRLKRLF